MTKKKPDGLRLTIDKATLVRLTGRLADAVAKTAIPILATCRLEAEGAHLAGTATDMELELRMSVPAAEITGAGIVCVDANRLHAIAAALEDGAIAELAVEGERLRLRSGRTSAALRTLPAEDFPVFADTAATHDFGMPAGDLSALLGAVAFAASSESARFYLCGIYLHEDGTQLRAAATDGHRLARAALPLPTGAADMPGVIVPSRSVALLQRLLAKAEGPVEIAIGAGIFRASIADASDDGYQALATKLIDGTFPDYQRVIPALSERPLIVGTAMLRAAIKRAALASEAEDKSRAIRIELDADALIITGGRPEGDELVERLDVRYAGPSLTVGFNSRYAVAALDRIVGERVELHAGDAMTPAILRDPDRAGDDLIVLMPMRV